MSAYHQEPVASSSANGSGVTRPRRGVEKIRIRTIGWMDWRRLTGLFRGIFPELTAGQISHYIRHYEETIAVAETREGLVGFYQFVPRDGGTAWLNYLGVIPAHYRGGVGSQLLLDYEKRAARMGFRQSECDVLQQNQKALCFYEKHGYTRLHPVDNKFRYRKALMVDVHAVGDPRPARTRPHLARVGRRVLYLMLVGLPPWHGEPRS